MATIQRPVKTYGTRKYVDEVAAAPANEDPVLANEVDDDLEGIYAAWNGGADTVNLKDNAVTVPKLEPAIQGAAQGKFPGAVSFAPRMLMYPTPTYGDIQMNSPSTPNFDNTKPTWLIRADYGGDAFQVWRAPAPGTVFATPLQLDGAGNLTVLGQAQFKGNAGGLFLGAPQTGIGNSTTVEIAMNTLWMDSGGNTNPSIHQVYSPNYWSVATVSVRINISGNAGFGVGITLENFVSGAWQQIASATFTLITQGLVLNRTALFGPRTPIHATFFNGTGGPVSINNADMAVVGHGSQ